MSLGINMLSSDTNFVNFTNEKDIIYEEDLIAVEYPQKSENGIAIIYHIEGWQNVEAVFSDVNIKFKYIVNKNEIILLY